MANWHSVDLTALDLGRVADVAQQASSAVAKRAADTARDALYVTVGLGLLTYQRAQVRRREIERARAA